MPRLLIFVKGALSTLLMILPLSGGDLNLTIMHLNDTHAHLEPVSLTLTIDGKTPTTVHTGGVARIKHAVDTIRATHPHTLLLHAGDVFQGTLYFTQTLGMADLAFMHLIGFDAMAVGNHEFDMGDPVLADFADAARFPLLAANITIPKAHPLYGRIAPYTIVTVGGERVGIIGLDTDATPAISSPGTALGFTDPFTAATIAVRALEAKGVDKIILLTHLGYRRDLEIAAGLTGVDVIVGGHSHTLLGDVGSLGLVSEGEYPTVIQDKEGHRVCIVQAWQWYALLGVLDVRLDSDGHITQCRGFPRFVVTDDFQEAGNPVDAGRKDRLLSLIRSNPYIDVVKEDPQAMTMLASYSAGLNAFRTTVIGKADTTLRHIRALENGGSQVAPHVTAAFFEKASRSGLSPDIVITNAGGIRADIRQGDITIEDIYELLPFNNTLVALKMTGTQVKTVLEEALSMVFDHHSTGAFPCASHLRFTLVKGRETGQRVTALEIQRPDGTWAKIKEDTVYTIITNSYVAAGKDGYTTFKTVNDRYDTGFGYAEAFMEYVKTHTVLHPLVDTRP